MSANFVVFLLCLLVCAVALLSATLFLVLRETAKCTKDRDTQDKLIVALLSKMEENQLNYCALTDKCTAAIIQVGVIVHDLHKYFENNALTKRLPIVQLEGE